jgi:methionyl-tRNA formyltransferase
MKLKVALCIHPLVEHYDVVKYAIEEEGDSVIVYKSQTDLETFKSDKVDFIVSYGYRFLFKGELLNVYEGKIINLHPSFLPYGRGYYPNFWSHFYDFPKGVSIHRINDGIDTGPLLAQRQHYFSRQHTLRSSYYTLQTSLISLFTKYWSKIRSDSLTPIEQDQYSGNLFYKKQFDQVFDLLPKGFDTNIGEIKLLHEAIINRLNQIK